MEAISIESAEHYSWGEGCSGWHLMKSEGASVIQEMVPPGKSEVRHFHNRAQQFFFVLSGEATIEADGTRVILRSGQGLPIPPRVPHQFRNDSSSKVEFLVISAPPSHGDRENL